jgi:hypothetical protein
MPSRSSRRRNSRSRRGWGNRGGGSSRGGSRRNESRAMAASRSVPPPLGVGTIFKVTRNWQQANIVMAAGTFVLAVANMAVSSFSAAFDNFLTSWDLARFDYVDVTFAPAWGSAVSTGSIPMIAIVPNYDDSSAPASFDAVAGAGGSVLRLFNRPVRKRCSAPVLLTPAIAGGGTLATNGLVAFGQWFNPGIVTLTNLAVPLVKYAITAVPTIPAGGQVFINLRIHLSLAQPVMG